MAPGAQSMVGDPLALPEALRERIDIGRVDGGTVRGRRIHVEVCALCGTVALAWSEALDLADAPNELGKANWIQYPGERCSRCSPIFYRYPEIAQWVAMVIGFQKELVSP